MDWNLRYIGRFALGSLCMILACVGCNVASTASKQTSLRNQGIVFHFIIQSRSRVPEAISVKMDGREIFRSQTFVGGTSKTFEIAAAPGWHKIESIAAKGVRHQAMVAADCGKWILIRREPSRSEGFGVHITEYAQ